MSFKNISNLSNSKIEPCSYFLDANIWIYALQSFENLDPRNTSYYDFFYDIVESHLTPKPKILLPSLLLSEIINTFLKKIAIPEYRRLNFIPSSVTTNFKKDYRPTKHYKDSYERIMDDIVSLKSCIEFVDDGAIVNEQYLLVKDIADFDFNDYLYYCLCKELNYSRRVIIVTNDGDFKINDIEIVTANKKLLSLK